jgi:hypothetical protein
MLMKIGDPVVNRFIKSNPNFQTKKLTITSPLGGKTTRKSCFTSEMQPSPLCAMLQNGFDSQTSY